jgi:hypothetical protein
MKSQEISLINKMVGSGVIGQYRLKFRIFRLLPGTGIGELHAKINLAWQVESQRIRHGQMNAPTDSETVATS